MSEMLDAGFVVERAHTVIFLGPVRSCQEGLHRLFSLVLFNPVGSALDKYVPLASPVNSQMRVQINNHKEGFRGRLNSSEQAQDSCEERTRNRDGQS